MTATDRPQTAPGITAPIDVLATLEGAGNFLIAKGANPADVVALHEARAAIAELIERAQSLSDSITFRIDDPRCELHCKLVDALANVSGGAL